MTSAARPRERGAETLEFLGLIPLLLIVAMIIWQGLVLLAERGEAEADARTIARSAVVCGATPLTLAAVDPSADGVVHLDTGRPPLVSVRVVLTPQAVSQHIDLAALGIPHPAATVTMRHEPC